MMDVQIIVKQILGRAVELLDQYGLGPEAAARIQAEASVLAEILLDAEASDDAKVAARKALQAIPLRVKEQAIAARVDVVDRLKMVGEALVRGLLGVVDLSFGR